MSIATSLVSGEDTKKLSVTNVTNNYNATANDDLILVDASGGGVTVNLPTAAGITGNTIRIKKTDSSLNTVTLDPNGSETVDGETTFTISFQFEAASIASDNSNWHII